MFAHWDEVWFWAAMGTIGAIVYIVGYSYGKKD